MIYIKYIITAIGPVLLAWLLGVIKLPDTINYLDYSRGGTDLLDLSPELRKDIKVSSIDEKEVENLSIYNVNFINNSDRNFGNTKISFKIENSTNSKLIASSLQGPENFPNSSIQKIAPNKDGETYTIDHINRAGDQARNYFTASFLFSGNPPIKIEPISHEKGIEFRASSENPRNKWVAGSIFFIGILLYISFFVWMIRWGNRSLEAKKLRYHSDLAHYISNEFNSSEDEADEQVTRIEEIRNSCYNTPNYLKRLVRRLIN